MRRAVGTADILYSQQQGRHAFFSDGCRNARQHNARQLQELFRWCVCSAINDLSCYIIIYKI